MTMVYKRADLFIFLLVFLEIKFLDAQVVNTSGNQGDPITSIDPRFSDRGGRGRGYPNFPNPGRNGNPQSNYPGNSFYPDGNQNGNMRRPGPDFGYRPDDQYPNSRKPNQGSYPDNYPERNPGNRPDNYPENYPGNRRDTRYPPNNYRPDDYNNENGRGPNNRNPNYQRPPYENRPEYPGYTDRPYTNEPRPFQPDAYPNRPGNYGDSRWPEGYPANNGKYPPQGNFQGNPNQQPGGSNPNYRPDYPDDILESQIKFPGSNGRPNQYPPNDNVFNYPNNPNVNQFPYQGDINQGSGNYRPGSNEVFQGNFNGIPPTRPQMPNNRPIDSINGPNTNDSVNIPGKPVFVPSTNSPNGQVMLDSSTESPLQQQCQLNCPTTSEYNPICGTNNVTYGNPGRYNCARNCGVAVNLRQMGRCPTEVPAH